MGHWEVCDGLDKEIERPYSVQAFALSKSAKKVTGDRRSIIALQATISTGSQRAKLRYLGKKHLIRPQYIVRVNGNIPLSISTVQSKAMN